MAFISFTEILQILVTVGFMGFIFSDMFPKRIKDKDLFKPKPIIDWDSLKFAAMVTGPALVLHELAHKSLAISFGMQATYQAAFNWLVFGLILKLLNFGLIVIVPAFVSITGNGTNLQFAFIALAGPLTNCLLWLGLELAIRKKLIPKKHFALAHFGKEINRFLFIFNMIPIPGFDGFQFFTHLLKAFGVPLPF
jgi:Zn-dependent protease